MAEVSWKSVKGGEQTLMVVGEAGVLETVVHLPNELSDAPTAVAIVCHPHPMFGGTMDNKVVTTLIRAYRDAGLVAVRFNFRGVGASEGQFDEARGECRDLQAVRAWVSQQFPSARHLLAGFSFGASIVAQAHEGCLGLQLVAPPVGRFGLVNMESVACPSAVITGANDDLVPVAEVETWVAQHLPAANLCVVDGCSHFFHGHLTALKQHAQSNAEQWCGLVV